MLLICQVSVFQYCVVGLPFVSHSIVAFTVLRIVSLFCFVSCGLLVVCECAFVISAQYSHYLVLISFAAVAPQEYVVFVFLGVLGGVLGAACIFYNMLVSRLHAEPAICLKSPGMILFVALA